MNGMLQFVQENFMHVAPILAAGALGLIIIFERGLAIFWAYPLSNPRAFFDKIRNYILNERIGEAIALCEHYRGKPIANVVREGLLRAHQPESVIVHGLEIAVGEAQDRIQARVPFLAMIANVATLLGLLGTIMGLIQSFEAVGSASAQQRSALLAAGISTAMNATMFGLAVAIPCMVAFSFLTNRANRLAAETERSAVRVMELIKQRYFSAGEGTPGAPQSGGRSNNVKPMARHA
ncbi:MAG: MotA/TolQ/ExbB proton channel family protein [Bdellovibrionales bacterium]|nr:MotA/TolQ/ExbB proton channel family protein [Oligoflexia bacterium]